jgi:lipid-binding SYLF domain-containing protein
VAYFVLAAWILQGAVGVRLLAGRLRQRGTWTVLGHVGLSVGGLGPWIAFLETDDAVWGWAALGLITVGNSLGDSLLRKRWLRMGRVSSSFLRDYAAAVRAVLMGRMPTFVVFHALFAGVVYFSAVAACVAA